MSNFVEKCKFYRDLFNSFGGGGNMVAEVQAW